MTVTTVHIVLTVRCRLAALDELDDRGKASRPKAPGWDITSNRRNTTGTVSGIGRQVRRDREHARDVAEES
jgi:hypothetical protein